jgi:hypothetical protein
MILLVPFFLFEKEKSELMESNKQDIKLLVVNNLTKFLKVSKFSKDKLHKTRERAISDRLWPEIEVLNWVLNEILVLSRTS